MIHGIGPELILKQDLGKTKQLFLCCEEVADLPGCRKGGILWR
jgi:hypothetical protein